MSHRRPYLVEAGGSVAVRVKVVLDPPSQLQESDVVVEVGVDVVGMLVDLLDLYALLVDRLGSQGVDFYLEMENYIFQYFV